MGSLLVGLAVREVQRGFFNWTVKTLKGKSELVVVLG